MPPLEIRHAYVPVTWQCVECSRDFHPRAQNEIRCPDCQKKRTQVEEVRARSESQRRRIRRRHTTRLMLINGKTVFVFVAAFAFGTGAYGLRYGQIAGNGFALALIVCFACISWNWRPHNRLRRGFDRMFPKGGYRRYAYFKRRN